MTKAKAKAKAMVAPRSSSSNSISMSSICASSTCLRMSIKNGTHRSAKCASINAKRSLSGRVRAPVSRSVDIILWRHSTLRWTLRRPWILRLHRMGILAGSPSLRLCACLKWIRLPPVFRPSLPLPMRVVVVAVVVAVAMVVDVTARSVRFARRAAICCDVRVARMCGIVAPRIKHAIGSFIKRSAVRASIAPNSNRSLSSLTTTRWCAARLKCRCVVHSRFVVFRRRCAVVNVRTRNAWICARFSAIRIRLACGNVPCV
mmetsp:Transcript_40776/g.67046  ORF Transcript_40776/g.67046 Transcript_40776/m.67046 type:complete len:260 (-) Transcript_40776:182-961(-)